MDEIPNLGIMEDRKTCVEKQRADTDEYWKLVQEARKTLYKEGYAVDGEKVDGLLKGESLVPTEVCAMAYCQNLCSDTVSAYSG